MSREEMRLEILKLTHTLGRDPAEATARAKVLEDYIYQESKEEPLLAPATKKAGRLKKTDNIDILS